jgi:hypothetical protein
VLNFLFSILCKKKKVYDSPLRAFWGTFAVQSTGTVKTVLPTQILKNLFNT